MKGSQIKTETGSIDLWQFAQGFTKGITHLKGVYKERKHYLIRGNGSMTYALLKRPTVISLSRETNDHSFLENRVYVKIHHTT